jgi:sodium-dependent dicarboxylate transporter 2/3/5
MLYGAPVMLLLTFIAWWVLVRLFMKDDVRLPQENVEPAKNEIAREFRLKRWTVVVILSVTLLLWLTSPIHKLNAAAVSAIPLVLLPMTGILKAEDIRSIGWDTLMLVAGGLALGIGLQQTGLLDHYAGAIAALHVPRIAFYFLLGYATMFFSNIMSNTATSTVIIPLGVSILPGNVREICMIVGLAASTALFLPVSTPPNAIAYSTGMIEQKDFRIGGLLIGLLGPAIIVLWVLLIT